MARHGRDVAQIHPAKAWSHAAPAASPSQPRQRRNDQIERGIEAMHACLPNRSGKTRRDAAGRPCAARLSDDEATQGAGQDPRVGARSLGPASHDQRQRGPASLRFARLTPPEASPPRQCRRSECGKAPPPYATNRRPAGSCMLPVTPGITRLDPPGPLGWTATHGPAAAAPSAGAIYPACCPAKSPCPAPASQRRPRYSIGFREIL